MADDKHVNEAVEEAIRWALMDEMKDQGVDVPVFARRAEAKAEPPFVVVLAADAYELTPGGDAYEINVKIGLTTLKNQGDPKDLSKLERGLYLAMKNIQPGETDSVRICGFGLDGGAKTVDKDGLRGKIWTSRVGAHMK